MEQPIVAEALAHLRSLLEANDLDGAIALIESLRPPDQADVFSELPTAQQQRLLPQINIEDLADILEKMEETEAAELARGLDVSTLAHILDEMQPDEAADLLGDLLPDRVTAALAQMAEPEEVQPLLLHPDETAGGLMTSEFLALRPRMTAAQAIEAIRSWAPEAETVYYLFVVDREGRLCGAVNLRQLIVADPSTMVSDIMDPDVISVRADADQEECARLMSRYDLLALPVVDEENHLLGVITVDDLVEVLEEEATEDFQRLSGSQPLEQPYLSISPLTMARKRMGWLLLLFVTHTLTASVMRYFEHALETVVALSFFIPLLIGTGGNTGSQTITIIVRALALRELDLKDFLRAIWREAITGLIMGTGLSLIGLCLAVVLGVDIRLAITVAVAILSVVIWANIVGTLLPFISQRLGIDPAMGSAPGLDTVVDATGLLIYFAIAHLLLGI